MNDLLLLFTACVLIGGLIFTFDDLILDILGLWHGVAPRRLSTDAAALLAAHPEKRIAVLIANWKEDEILEAMVRGNLTRILYDHFTIFLGVYPNDPATLEVARNLEAAFSKVRVIVNTKSGPTTKGQLLNHMVRQIMEHERLAAETFDAILLHDSEDIIHPLSLRLMNAELDRADFVQIPVFSLPTCFRELTAGTYADEFAEAHTRHLLIRDRLGVAIPSAGVGTAVSRRLVRALLSENHGDFLNENTLTEDYQLGLTAGRLGFRTHFECAYVDHGAHRDYIATREYFPSKMAASVRQKTRWITGVAFQGWQALGWAKAAAENYFLWRDRRGPLNGIFILFNATLVLVFISHWIVFGNFPSFSDSPAFGLIFGTNFSHMVWRMFTRVRLTAEVYGWKYASLAVMRWPVANVINCIASGRAFFAYQKSVALKQPIAWVKTTHRLPIGFGGQKAKDYVY